MKLIVAMSENRAIGKGGTLPWHLPRDLKFFKTTTMGAPIIMGRKTFESIGRALPGRRNIVVSKSYSHPDVEVVGAIPQVDGAFIIGGAQIYNLALPQVDTIYCTRVHTEIDGDTFFPEFEQDFEKVSSEFVAQDDKNEFDLTFEVWQRLR